MVSENKKFELTDGELERVSGAKMDTGWICVHCDACNNDFTIEDPSDCLSNETCPGCGARESLSFLHN